jgi:hypothetical protein
MVVESSLIGYGDFLTQHRLQILYLDGLYCFARTRACYVALGLSMLSTACRGGGEYVP